MSIADQPTRRATGALPDGGLIAYSDGHARAPVPAGGPPTRRPTPARSFPTRPPDEAAAGLPRHPGSPTRRSPAHRGDPMTRPSDLLAAVAAGHDPGPFALVRREGADHVEVFTGPVRTADRLADIPLPDGGAGPRTLALVPYRQIAERGFDVRRRRHAAGVPDRRRRTDGTARRGARRAARRRRTHHRRPRFDIADDEYAAIVGPGARATRSAAARARTSSSTASSRPRVHGDPLAAALAALRPAAAARAGRVLDVPGAHRRPGPWSAPARSGTSASPTGWSMMNPISGTFRHRGGRRPGRAAATSSPTPRRSRSCTWCSTRS